MIQIQEYISVSVIMCHGKKEEINLNTKFDYAISEIQKYSLGVQQLNNGIDERTIQNFEVKYEMSIPNIYKQWLKIYNGGEFFAVPVGTSFAGILGDEGRRKGVFYLEDNFDDTKRVGILDNLFVIGELCDGEIIAFDLDATTKEDGCVVQFDLESAQVIVEWDGFAEWLNYIFEEGNGLFDYEGNEK